MELPKRITMTKGVCSGKPCIAGTRIAVHLMLSFMAGGETIESILQAYPQLKREDLLACLEFAAMLAQENAALFAAG